MDMPRDMAIVTSRLRLDRLRPSDAPALFAYRSDEETARYQGWKPASPEEAGIFIGEQLEHAFGSAGGWSQLAIRESANDELVGDLGIHFPKEHDDPIELGVTLRPDRQGSGFAREAMEAILHRAFGEWGYRRAVGSVDPRNVASLALLRSLGFRQEAHHVESYRFRGEWVDDVIFAMLAREWQARDKMHQS